MNKVLRLLQQMHLPIIKGIKLQSDAAVALALATSFVPPTTLMLNVQGHAC